MSFNIPLENSTTYQDNHVFENVYIYGELNYDFTGIENIEFTNVDIGGDVNITGVTTFLDDVYFTQDINANILRVGILTVTERSDIGVGGTVFRVVVSDTKNDPSGPDYLQPYAGRVGIGSTQPEQTLDVDGSVHISRDIYDSANSSGANGYYLNQDNNGIRWVPPPPVGIQGILIQENSQYIPLAGAAATFGAVNFTQTNSLGLGTDNLVADPDPDNPNFIARVRGKDYWGYMGGYTDPAVPIYRMSNVGIQNNNPQVALDVTGAVHATGAVDFDSTLNVDNNTTLQGTLEVTNATYLNSTLNVAGQTVIESTAGSSDKDSGALVVDGGVGIEQNLNVGNVARVLGVNDATNADTGALQVDGGVGINKKLYVGDTLTVVNNTDLDGQLNVEGQTTLQNNLIVNQDTDLDGTLNVDGNAVFNNPIELNSTLIDFNNTAAGPGVGKTDWRLSSVGTGVSWRPSGVETKNTIWVTKDGDDSNSGLLEGDAKGTLGAAAAIAQEGDSINIRAGIYVENNPIGLRTDVAITGEDLRLVTIVPANVGKDVFHVRNGCLIQNLNFAGSTQTTNHPGCAAVAFPPTLNALKANTGYIKLGPFVVPANKRYKSPYVRNCTNFMTGSIGMKINGDHATANAVGDDLKSMVCDSFTQYNENGIGVSLTNNGYAQLVSIFTINCDVAIFADTGGQCDLTNSNSSFGNFGLKAVGLGSTEFTGKVNIDTAAENDTIVFKELFDPANNARRPYDGQALYFNINLDNYPDADGTGRINAPLQQLKSVNIVNKGTGFSAISPPNIVIRDSDGTTTPKGPQGIVAEALATVDSFGQLSEIDVVSTGRNYLSTQNIVVDIDGDTSLATAVMEPIYYTVSAATTTTAAPAGITSVTFNEFIPYELKLDDPIDLRRISRILTSSHSFEYVGTGTDINRSTPLQGAVPIKENEVVALDGAQIPFTSTDQKGNFDIGAGIQVDQTTNTIRGRDFSRAIQAEVTPLILALR